MRQYNCVGNNKERRNQMANTIEYADSPNVDTAFVVQEGGQKNRAVLTAPQDTTTLELPDNPNSTKGYVTIDGKKHKVILTADISGNGGGGSSLPDQTGHAGQFLTTDGTDASWGTVPVISVNTTVTLASANWSSNTQTVNVTGMTATGVVLVSPIPADQADYTDAGILCTAQAAGTLTFTCDTTPSNNIDVVVVML